MSDDADLEPEIDRLYQVPLSSFTEERNALAARRRSAGDRGGATRVKGLAKPAAVAWAVNQLYWTDRERFDAVVEATERLAEAQRTGLAGGGPEEVRAALRLRKEAVRDAVKSVEDRLGAGGQRADATVLSRVASTLEALTARAGEGSERPGRLTSEIEAPGFDVALDLARGVVRDPAPTGSAVGAAAPDDEKRAARENAEKEARRQRAEIVRLDSEVSLRRREGLATTRALHEAEERLKGAQQERQEAERRLERAIARETKAREELAGTQQAREQAAEALRAAEAARHAEPSRSKE